MELTTNQNSKSKVLVIGATGYIGKFIALAGPKEGHPTLVLIRPETLNSKYELIESFKNSGITILQGSVDDHESLVAAFKQVDVVISAIGSSNLSDQLKIIEAIKEAGNIKRFFPSEFGCDVDRVNALEPAHAFFAEKVKLRRIIEEVGIPFTYVVANCFNGFFLSSLLQSLTTYFDPNAAPPKDKVKIYGSGKIKFINNCEEDIATYIIKTVDDRRTLNKTLHIRPAKNTVTFNEMVALWEMKIGKTLEKEIVTEEKLEKEIEDAPFPQNIHLAVVHAVLIKGDQCNFELGENDEEATSLYPDEDFVSVDEYLDRFINLNESESMLY